MSARVRLPLAMVDAALEALWKRVLADWDDDAAHAAFLEYCQSTQRLVEAAVRYRGIKGDREHAQVAEQRLKGIALLAMASLEATRPEQPKARRYWGALWFVLFVVVTILVLNYLAYGLAG